jgi:hypothetical protein
MTMQVALVGTDGVVLASDTNWAATRQVRYTYSRSKIKVNERRGIAASFARNMETSEQIANFVINALSDEEWVTPGGHIERVAASVIEKIEPDRSDIECLIVSSIPTLRVFLLEMGIDLSKGPELSPQCHQVGTKAFAGDDTNAAVFWAERYAKEKTTNQLVRLAAHLITAAGSINPGAIKGLEIVVCKKDGFHRLSPESIAVLESAAQQREKDIEALFAEAAPFGQL